MEVQICEECDFIEVLGPVFYGVEFPGPNVGQNLTELSLGFANN